MKVGILTYHRAENYGALLQAYATFTYLRRMGHDVSFVDYWPKYHSDYFKLFPWHQIQKLHHIWKIVFVVKLVLWFLPRYIRKRRFETFMNKELRLSTIPKYTEKTEWTEKYDVVVYGSDQIWRKQHLGGVDFDSWYFGSEKVIADRKIVYAGSMGVIDNTKVDDEYIKEMMKNFDSISVREEDLLSYLRGLGMSPSLVIDPVFLLSQQEWRKLEGKKKNDNDKYILFYNLLNTAESKHFAECLSEKTKLPIREINKKMSFSHIGRRYIYSASVSRFLQLIDGAEYVVSNSFHGVALSIIFEKQFYAVGMRKKANRVSSLLQSLGINDRYVKDDFNWSSDIINFEKVGSKLMQMRQFSEHYIQNSIKGLQTL